MAGCSHRLRRIARTSERRVRRWYSRAVATQDDVRRIATALPGVTASPQGFAFSVAHKGKDKGFAWVWMERIAPKKPRVPQPQVLAVRVADQAEKAALLAAAPETFFTEPHYNGFPAVLVRLPQISLPELQQVLAEAWRCMAPAALVAAYDVGNAGAQLQPAPRSGAPPATKPAARKSTRKPTAATPRKRR
jgi:hypothetical protein